jgi:hypothetical protein
MTAPDDMSIAGNSYVYASLKSIDLLIATEKRVASQFFDWLWASRKTARFAGRWPLRDTRASAMVA